MQKKIATIALLVILCFMTTTVFAASTTVSTRIKDIAKVQGVRSNQLIGYVLVVGLAGTGDSNKTLETLQSVGNMLKAFGVSIDSSQLKTKNVAAVMVTANLPAFARPGDTIDLTISSMGDAKSIQGGTLLQTPLKAANGQVYAVGQGAVSTGGFATSSGGGGTSKNFTTVGLSPNGGIVERDVEAKLGSDGTISLSLAKPDFTTAARITNAINSRFGNIAGANNPGTVNITVPYMYQNNLIGFVAELEDLYVTPDSIAKVVVNERTGTIVMGGNVAVDEVAIAQGGLNVNIVKTTSVNQPQPFSLGETIVSKDTDVQVTEDKAHTIVLSATANVSDVVGALNAIGATPRDIISILQAMKAAGALHADLEII